MEREDYLDKIDSLTSVIEQFKESYSLLKAGMDSSEKRNEALQSQVIRLQDIICTLTDEIRSLREEVSKQSDYTSVTIRCLMESFVYRVKFKYAEEISKDSDAAWFVEQIGLLYMVEAENIKLHRTYERSLYYR